MYIETITEAKAQLSALVERVLAGEEVVIGRAGKPVAKLVAVGDAPREPRKLGMLKGEFWMADDIDEWPDDIARALGVID